MNDSEAIHKVVVVGESGVGKTSIVHRFCHNNFSQETQPTIGSACMKNSVDIGDHSLRMNIWDTAGQERFQSLIPMYLKGAKACILVVDLSSEVDLKELSNYYEYIHDQLDDDCVLCVCGNKTDLINNDFDISPLQTWSKQRNCRTYKVSAKTGFGISDLFAEVALQIDKHYKQNTGDMSSLFAIHSRNVPKSCC